MDLQAQLSRFGYAKNRDYFVQNIQERIDRLTAQIRRIWTENGKGNQYSNEKYVFVNMDRRGDFKKIYLIIPKSHKLALFATNIISAMKHC